MNWPKTEEKTMMGLKKEQCSRNRHYTVLWLHLKSIYCTWILKVISYFSDGRETQVCSISYGTITWLSESDRLAKKWKKSQKSYSSQSVTPTTRLGQHTAVSGHRNEASIRSYCKTDISTKKKMYETLTTARAIECEILHPIWRDTWIE